MRKKAKTDPEKNAIKIQKHAKNAKQNYQRQMLTTGRLPSIKNIKIKLGKRE